MLEPKFDPFYYVLRRRYGSFTRMRALAAAIEAGLVSSIDDIVGWYDYILNLYPSNPTYTD